MAKINFNYNEPGANEPVRIENVFAEKPGGGLVSAPSFDILPTTAVYESNGKYLPIKGYRLVNAVAAADTSIKIAKGSGVAKNDFIGYGAVAVKATAVDTSNAAYDLVTVTMGVVIAKDEVLYEAAAASADAATPKGTPVFVTGNVCEAGNGDVPVRLINGANLRKETACIGKDIAKLLPSIALV